MGLLGCWISHAGADQGFKRVSLEWWIGSHGLSPGPKFPGSNKKSLGKNGGKHTAGKPREPSSNVVISRGVAGLTAERFSWFRGEKWHCKRKGEGRKMGILSNQDYVTI